MANNDEASGGVCVTTPSDLTGLDFPSDPQQPAPCSPSPRFEFYTDPLAAFSGSQKKKKSKNSLGSPFRGAPASPCKSPASPFWQPDFSSLNPNLRPPGNLNTSGLPNPYPNLPPPGSFSTPGPSNPDPNPNHHPHHFGMGKFYPGSFNTPNSNPNLNSNSSPHHSRGKFTPNSTPPASFSTPGSADFNLYTTPQGGYGNHGPSVYGPRSAYGSQQPLSVSQMYNGGGSGGPFMNTPAPYQYNRGCGGFSGDSPSQHRASSMNDVRSNARSQNSMNSGQSQGSNRSQQVKFMQSPGSTGRDNRTPGRSGGRGFQRTSNEVSAATNPELFAKRSMLLDPWKDLVPVRIESVAFRLNSCTVAGSRDWLPKSVSKGMLSPNAKGVVVSSSGPSLAESLAASFSDAVSGEDGT